MFQHKSLDMSSHKHFFTFIVQAEMSGCHVKAVMWTFMTRLIGGFLFLFKSVFASETLGDVVKQSGFDP